ncbi:hypothetical protein ACFX2I_027955 [Malus domestica]
MAGRGRVQDSLDHSLRRLDAVARELNGELDGLEWGGVGFCSCQEFPSGMVSWPMSTQLPGRLAPVEGCCRASAFLSGFVGQVSSGKSLSGKTLRARLVGQG